MKRDAYGLTTSTDSNEAQRAFEGAVFGVATHRPNTGPALQMTIAADPHHIAGHALKGFANLILAHSELATPAAEALKDARVALAAKSGGTGDERLLVKALEAPSTAPFLGLRTCSTMVSKIVRPFSCRSRFRRPCASCWATRPAC